MSISTLSDYRAAALAFVNTMLSVVKDKKQVAKALAYWQAPDGTERNAITDAFGTPGEALAYLEANKVNKGTTFYTGVVTAYMLAHDHTASYDELWERAKVLKDKALLSLENEETIAVSYITTVAEQESNKTNAQIASDARGDSATALMERGVASIQKQSPEYARMLSNGCPIDVVVVSIDAQIAALNAVRASILTA
jgi:hypothetical protein